MKQKVLYLILLLFTVILACDENFVIVNCDDCLFTEPTYAQISVELDHTSQYPAVVMIFEGELEDNILLNKSSAYSGKMEFSLQINKKYTFRVDYRGPDGSIYSAINSVYPRVKLELEQCSEVPCYYVYGNKLNMKIKYY